MSTEFMPIKISEVGGADVIIWAEVVEIEPSDSIVMTASDARVKTSFDTALNGLREAAKKAKECLDVLAPDELEVAFGITIGAEAGTPFFGLAKASSEASYTVKITWKKTPSPTEKA